MNSQAMVKVWDPLVRAFHWILVIAFFTAYFTEDDFLTVHTYAGYTVLALILVRLVWGVVGTRYARFSNFVTAPRVAWQYLKDTLKFRAKRYLGHNPAGGAMIVLLLISLLLTTLTGLAAYGASESAGPLAGWLGNIGETGEDILKKCTSFSPTSPCSWSPFTSPVSFSKAWPTARTWSAPCSTATSRPGMRQRQTKERRSTP